MAFVYRAERNINYSLNKNTENTFPGEYFNNSSLIKDIDRQSSEFQSNSKRDLCLSKLENTPGPGSYEKNFLSYNNYPYYPKKSKPKDIYETIKMNLIPKEILNFFERNQNIAFNSSKQRFNYNLEQKKEYPGPGSYSPNGSSINPKTNYSTAIFQNNTSKKSQSYNHSNIFPTTFSEYRTETIPSKGILGYENKNGLKKMVKSKIKDENLIGPGTYDINLKKKENGINWSRTSDEKDPKYNMIQFRKNLQPLTELEQNYIDNKNSSINSNSTSTKTSSKKFEKNAMFKYQMNRRSNMIRVIKSKLNSEKDLIFDADPGPGYYAPDLGSQFYKTQTGENNNINHKIKCFQSTSPRFNIKCSKLDEKRGPGYYFEKTKPDKVKKFKQKKGHFIDANKQLLENSAYKISNIKEDFKIPGPGSYENYRTFFPIKTHFINNNNFGITNERFKEEKNSNKDNPGPGYYNTYHEQYFKGAKSLPKFNQKNNKTLFTNYKLDLINVDEMSKITKDKFDVPPIGTYNPYIITTIDYKNRSKINTFTDKTVVGFGSQSKKVRSYIIKDNNKLLGPGMYYKNREKNVKQNVVPFNQNMKRFDYDEKNKNPGPGTYDTSSYDEWNKKSYNILFV